MATSPDGAAMRSTYEGSHILHFDGVGWRAFLAGVRDGEFDRPEAA